MDHNDCDGTPVLLDGYVLKQAGLEGGDLLYCPDCQWYGRPKKDDNQ